MKKLISLAILVMALCCNAFATTPDGEPEIHPRWGEDYQVTVPAGWEATDYAVEMVVKNEAKGIKLKFREYKNADIKNIIKNIGGDKKNRAKDLVNGDTTWQVYQAKRDEYNTCYIGVLPNKEIIVVWATPNDPENADVHTILKSVALK